MRNEPGWGRCWQGSESSGDDRWVILSLLFYCKACAFPQCIWGSGFLQLQQLQEVTQVGKSHGSAEGNYCTIKVKAEHFYLLLLRILMSVPSWNGNWKWFRRWYSITSWSTAAFAGGTSASSAEFHYFYQLWAVLPVTTHAFHSSFGGGICPSSSCLWNNHELTSDFPSHSGLSVKLFSIMGWGWDCYKWVKDSEKQSAVSSCNVTH